MTSPILLIAGREFRTYVATWSFWLSLALAPLAAGTAVFFSTGQPAPFPVSVQGGNAQLRQSASLALREAGHLEGRSFVFQQKGAEILMSMRSAGTLDVRFGDDFPLSPLGRAMVGHMIERDAVRALARTTPLVVEGKSAESAPDVERLSRLLAMMMLWLTLTGSLGMLLQAVVRERANRALETLLAAVQAWEIVTGKLLGVGAVSLLVLAGWLGSAAAITFFLPPAAGVVPAILAKLAEPVTLLRDALIYVCAFVFYGPATVALGAVARDSAAAQNAVRPMFVLLLAGFFIALVEAGKSTGSSWLTWLPPFTPFLLLVNSPGSVSFSSQAILLGILVAAGFVMLTLATRLLTVALRTPQIFVSTRTKPQSLV